MSDKPYLFQVNLKGMIELLSEHIYSSPDVFVRELLQNGIDAITARKLIEESHQGELNIFVKEQKEIIFQDNGIGLTEKEVHEFLSVIGQSSKRGDLAEKDFIGKFGIGLLSCFVVSDKIIVETRSLLSKEAIRWTGKADGTYQIAKIKEEIPIGTKVILHPKKDRKLLFEKEDLKKNILFYGDALPLKIQIHSEDATEILVDLKPVWLDPNSSKNELLEYGKSVFNINFIDVFRLESKSADLTGIGFIMPHKVQLTNSNNAHKVYLKRMYLCDRPGNLLPEWASFVKCVFNTNNLKPTASREALMDNKELREAKKELNMNFKDYLKVLALQDVDTLREIISTHHLYIKAVATEDSEFLKLFMNYIPFETNKGTLTFGNIISNEKHLYYTPSLDDFRQIRRIAGSQGKTVINAAYSFESELIRKASIFCPEVILEKITPHEVLSSFGNVDESEVYLKFEERANEVLKKHFCKAEVRSFEPTDTPVIYVANEEALSNKNIQNLTEGTNPFASTLHNFIKKQESSPVLCFNKDNKLIDDLVVIEDDLLFEAVVQILYVQALLLGNYPVNKKEMTVFNDAIYKLLIMGMSNFSDNLIL